MTNPSPPLQVVVPHYAKNVHIRNWSLGRHISVLCFVSATGRSVPPSIVVEGKGVKAAWMESYPEALWGWDKAGYLAEGPFYSSILKWLELSEPEGGRVDNPRLLFMDSYRSHIDPAVLELLRAHNVRVVTFHPHTTHLFCVLDTAVFAIFKRVLKDFFEDETLEITMLNVGGFIKRAWAAASVITVDSVTGAQSSAATKGFVSAGLVPFDRKIIEGVVEGKHAAIAKLFQEQKAKTAASGVAMSPAAKSIRLTKEEKDAIIADFEKQHLQVKGHAVTPYDATKNRPRKMLSEVATGSEYIAKAKAAEQAKADEVDAKEARKVAREAKSAQKKLDDAAKAAQRVAKEKVRADKKAAVAAKVAAKQATKATPPKKAAVAGAPKRARDAPEDVYGRIYTKTRGR